MVAPVGIPEAIADKLNREIVEVLRAPAFTGRIRDLGGEVAPGTPAEFAAFIAGESARLKKLVESTGVRMD